MHPKPMILLSFLLAASLSACNLPGSDNATPTSSADAVMTRAAATVSFELTQAAANQPTSTATPSPTATPTVTITPATTATLRPTTAPQTGGNTGCDAAGFVRDVTVDDRTQMTPGQTFTKTWRLKNTGTCEWTTSYTLVFVSGDIMGGPTSQKLTASVPVGQEIDISVNLTAPTGAATYTGNWMLANAVGTRFGVDGGSPFWVIIVVGSGPTATLAGPTNTPGGPTNTPAPSATASPSLYSSASSVAVSETFRLDLDVGNVSPSGGGYDFQFTANSSSDKAIAPQNGAVFGVWGSSAPSLANCAGATMGSGTIQVNSGLVGQYLCYRTNDGRVGFLKVLSLTPADAGSVQTLEVSFSTYDTP
ncbi:MAG: hypothetical protein EPO32_01980 [Anaerolineae bacterium]|nr:MAG: hypothetical protein EPO32_01980 [Anaerolineae bacterium]